MAGKSKMRLVDKRNMELAKMADRLKYLRGIQDEFVASESLFYELTETLLESEIKFSTLDISALSRLILDNIDSLRKKRTKKTVSKEESDMSPDAPSPVEDTYSVGL